MEGLTPRPYTDADDLQKMRDLLVEGRWANNGTYYVHPGDLNWWLFYPPLEFDLRQYIVAALPDGQIGSFGIVWTDRVNRIGLFEPVGTHPAFRGKRLAKAVMLEGLRRLQERGMKQAILCTNEDNLPAVKLYESVGFKIVDKHLTFEKEI